MYKLLEMQKKRKQRYGPFKPKGNVLIPAKNVGFVDLTQNSAKKTIDTKKKVQFPWIAKTEKLPGENFDVSQAPTDWLKSSAGEVDALNYTTLGKEAEFAKKYRKNSRSFRAVGLSPKPWDESAYSRDIHYSNVEKSAKKEQKKIRENRSNDAQTPVHGKVLDYKDIEAVSRGRQISSKGYDAKTILAEEKKARASATIKTEHNSLDEYKQEVKKVATKNFEDSARAYDEELVLGKADTTGNTVSAVKKRSKMLHLSQKMNGLVEKIEDYSSRLYKDSCFKGQFKANYANGRLNQDTNKAYSEYVNNPTDENLLYAFAMDKLTEDFQKNNIEAMTTDEGEQGFKKWVFNWVATDFAGHLPQQLDQFGAKAIGAGAGALFGAATGMPMDKSAKVGAVLASGVESYTLMQGAAFRALIEAGVDKETAMSAAKDEAFISSLIEMADTGIDIATLGTGKLLSMLGKSGVKGVSKYAVKKTGKEVLKGVGSFAGNIAGEGAQEGLQEIISVANERRTKKGEKGIWSLTTESADVVWNILTGTEDDETVERVTEASKAGMRVAIMFGGAEKGVTKVAEVGINHHNTKVEGREILADRNKAMSLANVLIALGDDSTAGDIDTLLGTVSGANSASARTVGKIQEKVNEKIGELFGRAVADSGKTPKAAQLANILIEKEKNGESVTLKDIQSLKRIYDNESSAKTGNTETVVSQLNDMEQDGVKVKNDIASEYVSDGRKLAEADKRSKIWKSILLGEEVTDAQIKSLGLNSKATAKIFKDYTGMSLDENLPVEDKISLVRHTLELMQQNNEAVSVSPALRRTLVNFANNMNESLMSAEEYEQNTYGDKKNKKVDYAKVRKSYFEYVMNNRYIVYDNELYTMADFINNAILGDIPGISSANEAVKLFENIMNEMEQEGYEESETNKAGFKQSETPLRGADTGRQTVEYDGRSVEEIPGEQKKLTNRNAEVSNERIVHEAEWSPLMKEAAKRNKAAGLDTVYFDGELYVDVRDSLIRIFGALDTEQESIFATDYNTADHEFAHAVFKSEAGQAVMSNVFSKVGKRLGEISVNKIQEQYAKLYENCYGELTDSSAQAAYFEEFLADAFADIQREGIDIDISEFVDEVRKAVYEETGYTAAGITPESMGYTEDVHGDKRGVLNIKSNGTMYNVGMSFEEQVDAALKNDSKKLPSNLSVYIGRISTDILKKVGLDITLPWLTNQSHLRDAHHEKWTPKTPEEKLAFDKGELKNPHREWHGITETQIKKIPELIKSPVAVFDSISQNSKENTICILTSEFDPDGLPIIIAIKNEDERINVYTEGFADIATNNSNFVKSIYGREGIYKHLKDLLVNDAFLHVNLFRMKELLDKMEKSKIITNDNKVEFLKSLKTLGFSTNIVHQSRNIVKTKNEKNSTEYNSTDNNSMQKVEKNSPKTPFSVAGPSKTAEEIYLERLAEEKEESARRLGIEMRKADFLVAEKEFATIMHERRRLAATQRRYRVLIARSEFERAQRSPEAMKAYRIMKANEALKKELNRDGVNLPEGLANIPGMQEAASKTAVVAKKLRTIWRKTYSAIVNDTQTISDFSNLQREYLAPMMSSDKVHRQLTADILMHQLLGCENTAQAVLHDGLFDKAGNIVNEKSFEKVMLCFDSKGKVDEEAQAIFQDYLLHLHNIDRMSFVDNAANKVAEFEKLHPEIKSMDTREIGILAGMTEKQAEKYGKEAERELVLEYLNLKESQNESANKPVFGDTVTAKVSRKVVAEYEQKYSWLKEKSEELQEWYNQFMQIWAVGELINKDVWERLKETYPNYVPTYRVSSKQDKGTMVLRPKSTSVKGVLQKATGGSSEVQPIEDSFAMLIYKIIKRNRMNDLAMNIIDSAVLLNNTGELDGYVIADDSTVRYYEKNNVLTADELLDTNMPDMDDNAIFTKSEEEAAGKSKGKKQTGIYTLTAWNDGKQVKAYISGDMYKSLIAAMGYADDTKIKTLTKIGRAISMPMKTMVTGINIFFGVKNVFRDVGTAYINGTAGCKLINYWFKAAKMMAKNSKEWRAFKALGGTHTSYYNETDGVIKAWKKQNSKFKKATGMVLGAFGEFNNFLESATRFSEYLATIDSLGDSTATRMIAMKNAAEVTVDFSRKGEYGGLINAWVPYWNPAVQGIDKLFRSMVDSGKSTKKAGKDFMATKSGKAFKNLLKQSAKTPVAKALLSQVGAEILQQLILKWTDEEDEWEKLDDRTRLTYYCIPIPWEHKFLKLPRNRDWGSLIGAPLAQLWMKDGGSGTDKFWNWVEVSLVPNFMPPGIIKDNILVGPILELAENEDFAGRDIIPYDLKEAGKEYQWDSETSLLSYGISKAWNKVVGTIAGDMSESVKLSPMQADYLIHSYCGDFVSTIIDLIPMEMLDEDYKVTEKGGEIAYNLAVKPFVADNRYSSVITSNYYDTMDMLDKKVNGLKAHDDNYKETKEYQTQKAIKDSFGKEITALNKKARELPDGEEKDFVKAEIVAVCSDALEYYRKCTAGQIDNPILDTTYKMFEADVKKELIRMDKFADDYNFEPTIPSSSRKSDMRISVPNLKNKEYILTPEQTDEVYADIYIRCFEAEYGRVIDSSSYNDANDKTKAKRLEKAKQSAKEKAAREMITWLKDNGCKPVQKK